MYPRRISETMAIRQAVSFGSVEVLPFPDDSVCVRRNRSERSSRRAEKNSVAGFRDRFFGSDSGNDSADESTSLVAKFKIDSVPALRLWKPFVSCCRNARQFAFCVKRSRTKL